MLPVPDLLKSHFDQVAPFLALMGELGVTRTRTLLFAAVLVTLLALVFAFGRQAKIARDVHSLRSFAPLLRALAARPSEQPDELIKLQSPVDLKTFPDFVVFQHDVKAFRLHIDALEKTNGDLVALCSKLFETLMAHESRGFVRSPDETPCDLEASVPPLPALPQDFPICTSAAYPVDKFQLVTSGQVGNVIQEPYTVGVSRESFPLPKNSLGSPSAKSAGLPLCKPTLVELCVEPDPARLPDSWAPKIGVLSTHQAAAMGGRPAPEAKAPRV